MKFEEDRAELVALQLLLLLLLQSKQIKAVSQPANSTSISSCSSCSNTSNTHGLALYVEGERERLSDKSLSSELQYFLGKGILQQ